jgi:glycosyltransferase involved in cell wall biosynthesis
MIKLSVVIITYNEEHNIARCLESVCEIADEIIVVDSYSKDDTVSLSKLHGAIVFQNKFEGHIQQKNYALTKASFDHILSLDADEALSNLLKHEIMLIKKNFLFDGYYLKRLTNYCGHWVKYCGWYPDKKLRLFNKQKGMWTGMNPHDKFVLHNGDENAGMLAGDILHYSYYTVAEHVNQMKYFSEIAAKEIYRKGKKVYKIQIIINPLLHFLKSFIIKLGFLDGWRGLQICSISSYGTYLKYKKLFQLRKLARNSSET